MTLAFCFLGRRGLFHLAAGWRGFCMGGLTENLCFETHLLVCIAGRVDVGVLSAQSGCVQAVCSLFSMRQNVGRLDGCRRDAGCGCRYIDF